MAARHREIILYDQHRLHIPCMYVALNVNSSNFRSSYNYQCSIELKVLQNNSNYGCSMLYQIVASKTAFPSLVFASLAWCYKAFAKKFSTRG